jgi:hypothetical protein
MRGGPGAVLSRETGAKPRGHVAAPEPGDGSRRRGGMWWPRSYPELRGGSRSHEDTRRPRRNPKPGDGS